MAYVVGSKRCRGAKVVESLQEEFVQFETNTTTPAVSPIAGSLWFEDSALTTGRAGFKYAEDATDVRTIPDYDVGSFTPNLRYGSTDVTPLTDADGYWVRVGGVVTVTCHIVWTADITSGGGAALNVDNMPFAKLGAISTLALPVAQWQQFTTSNGAHMTARFTSSATQVTFGWCNVAGADVSSVIASESDAAGTKVIGFSFSYPIDPLT